MRAQSEHDVLVVFVRPFAGRGGYVLYVAFQKVTAICSLSFLVAAEMHVMFLPHALSGCSDANLQPSSRNARSRAAGSLMTIAANEAMVHQPSERDKSESQ